MSLVAIVKFSRRTAQIAARAINLVPEAEVQTTILELMADIEAVLNRLDARSGPVERRVEATVGEFLLGTSQAIISLLAGDGDIECRLSVLDQK